MIVDARASTRRSRAHACTGRPQDSTRLGSDMTRRPAGGTLPRAVPDFRDVAPLAVAHLSAMAPLVHIALVQFKPRKGDYADNLARIWASCSRRRTRSSRGRSVLHLPETALTGYFLEGGVREHAVTAGTLAADLQRAYRDAVPARRRSTSCSASTRSGATRCTTARCTSRSAARRPLVRHVHRKNFLPTYGLFDEERFVERGNRDPRVRHAVGPRGDARLRGRVAHPDRDDCRARRRAARSSSRSARAGAGPGRGTTGFPVRRAWRAGSDWCATSPRSTACSCRSRISRERGRQVVPGRRDAGRPKGEVRVARAAVGRGDRCRSPIDLGDLTRARADMPLLADLETMMPHLVRFVRRRSAGGRRSRAARRTTAWTRSPRRCRAPAPSPSAGRRGALRAAARPRCRGRAARPRPARRRRWTSIRRSSSEWLVRVPARRDCRAAASRRAVVGDLGRRGLGGDRVPRGARARARRTWSACGMPYRTSSPDSLDARAARDRRAGHRGAHARHQRARWTATWPNEPDADATRRGNVMARMRMIALFDLSAQLRGHSARHRQQDRAPVRLLHLARRRFAADQSVGRPVQDAGVGAGAAPRRARP